MAQLEILSTPTVDTPGTCLMLSIGDGSRYMFGNFHEGLQRQVATSKSRLARVSNAFITGRTEWKSVGGMLGTILTLAAQATPYQEHIRKLRMLGKKVDEQPHSLEIHAPPNMSYMLATMRSFILRNALPVHISENVEGSSETTAWAPTWSNDILQVWALPVELDAPDTESTPATDAEQGELSPARKRDFTEFAETSADLRDKTSANGSSLSIDDGQRLKDSQTLKEVVASMFSSSWRLDALFPTPLGQVQMPATIFVRDSESKDIRKYEGPEPGSGQEDPELEVLVRKPWPAARIAELPKTSPSPTSMSYLVKQVPIRGRFDTKAATALGVKPGPAFSKLANGESVILPDGTEVKPEQVLGEPRIAPGFGIIDIPSRKYLGPTLSRPEWQQADVMSSIKLIVWNLGPGVIDDARLKQFIEANAEMQHVISSPEACANRLSLAGSAILATRHSLLDEAHFPVPVHNNNPQKYLHTWKNTVGAVAGLTYKLAAEAPVSVENEPAPINTEMALDMKNKAVAMAWDARQIMSSAEVQQKFSEQGLPSSSAEVVALGTGSAAPSKYRGVSATLLRIPGYGAYLLDCGEGTLGQMARVFPHKDLQRVLRELRMITISHMHVDHHGGLISVIQAWRQAMGNDATSIKLDAGASRGEVLEALSLRNRLVIAAEPRMLQWLDEYAAIEDYGHSSLLPLAVEPCEVADSVPTALKFGSVTLKLDGYDADIKNALLDGTGLSGFAAANVQHCKNAMGYSISLPSGFKATYSGDTRPSGNLVAIGEASTLLIHEATFEDDAQGHAYAKRHSTTSEAIAVAQAMNARRVMLTHFSSRYQKRLFLSEADAKPAAVTSDMGSNDVGGRNPEVYVEPSAVDENETDDISHPLDDLEDEEDAVDANGELLPPLPSVEDRQSPLSRAFARLKAALQGTLERNPEMKVIVATDMMRIKVRDMMFMEYYAPAFLKMYEDPHIGHEHFADRYVASPGRSDDDPATRIDDFKSAKTKNKTRKGRPSAARDKPTASAEPLSDLA